LRNLEHCQMFLCGLWQVPKRWLNMVTSSPADSLYTSIENETRVLSRLNMVISSIHEEGDACPLNWKHVERPHVCEKLRFKFQNAKLRSSELPNAAQIPS